MKKRIALFLAIAMIVTLLAERPPRRHLHLLREREAGLLHSLWAQTSW